LIEAPQMDVNFFFQLVTAAVAIGIAVWRVSAVINGACKKIEDRIMALELKISKIEAITETVKEDHDKLTEICVYNEQNKASLDQCHSKVRSLESNFGGLNQVISGLRAKGVNHG